MTGSERPIRSANGNAATEALKLLALLGDGGWMFNLETGRVSTSGPLFGTMGYSEDETPDGMAEIMALIHPGDDKLLMGLLEALAKGRRQRGEIHVRCRAKDSTWRWFRLQASRLSEEESCSSTVLAILTDVTEQKQREAEAQQAQALVQLAQNSAGAGTWDIDLASGQLHLCPTSLEMHGLPPDCPMPISQQAWAETVDPASLEVVSRKFQAAVASGENYSAEYKIKGSERWVLGTGRAVMDAQGMPVRFIGLNQDITDLKTSKLMIAQMQNQLIHLARVSAMGTMASTIAHELNQPLAAISMYSAAARRLLAEGNEDVGEILDHIARAAGRGGAVIRHLRSAIQKRDPQPQQVRLEEVMNSALQIALLDARREGVDVDVSMPCGLTVEGDPIQLEQVILNLVRNAMEAMQDSDVKRLSINGTKGDSLVEICFADSGCGISAQDADTLFEPFVTTKANGMGIGLSISRTIVEAHGGKLWAQANDDAGATFCIILPTDKMAA